MVEEIGERDKGLRVKDKGSIGLRDEERGLRFKS